MENFMHLLFNIMIYLIIIGTQFLNHMICGRQQFNIQKSAACVCFADDLGDAVDDVHRGFVDMSGEDADEVLRPEYGPVEVHRCAGMTIAAPGLTAFKLPAAVVLR